MTPSIFHPAGCRPVSTQNTNRYNCNKTGAVKVPRVRIAQRLLDEFERHAQLRTRHTARKQGDDISRPGRRLGALTEQFPAQRTIGCAPVTRHGWVGPAPCRRHWTPDA
jgi:hypothetical protein